MFTISLNKITVVFALIMLFQIKLLSQENSKPVYKKFVQDNTIGNNSGSVLIFYADNTFINHGILQDITNQEVYVWYTYGTWTAGNEIIICNSSKDVFDKAKTIENIKIGYKTRADYRMVDNYYEFVNEKYSEHSFNIKAGKAIDDLKRIEYKEVINNANK